MEKDRIIEFSSDRGNIYRLRVYISGDGVYIIARDLIREMGYTGSWSADMIEKHAGEGSVARFETRRSKQQMIISIDSAMRMIAEKRRRDKVKTTLAEEEIDKLDYLEFFIQNEVIKHPAVLTRYAKRLEVDDPEKTTDVNMTEEKARRSEVRIDIAYKIFFVMLAIQIVLAAAGVYVLFFD